MKRVTKYASSVSLGQLDMPTSFALSLLIRTQRALDGLRAKRALYSRAACLLFSWLGERDATTQNIPQCLLKYDLVFS